VVQTYVFFLFILTSYSDNSVAVSSVNSFGCVLIHENGIFFFDKVLPSVILNILSE
jgi:hypothetical protein